jgi:cytochrome c peroxidase
MHAPGSDPRAPEVHAWSELGLADRQAIDRTFANLGKVIEACERRLLSRPAPFDRYVVPHLTPAQQLDLVAFLRTLTGPALPADLTRALAHS